MNLKRILFRCFLAAQSFLFLGFYFFGENGIIELSKLNKDLELQKKDIENFSNEIIVLKKYIKEFGSDPFYKEQIAREQLHMAKTDEDVYIIRN